MATASTDKSYPPLAAFAEAMVSPRGTPAEAYLHRRCPYLAARGYFPPCAYWLPTGRLAYHSGSDIAATTLGKVAGAIAWRYQRITDIAATTEAETRGWQLEPLDDNGERIGYRNANGGNLKRRTFHTTTEAVAVCYRKPTSDEGAVVVVGESPLDALAATWLAARDGKSVAAAFATAGTSGIKSLALPPDLPILVYADGDTAGRYAAIAAAVRMEAEIVFSQESEDPTDFALKQYRTRTETERQPE